MRARYVRWIAALVALATLFSVAGCAGGNGETTLTVLDWSGYEQEVFWQDFKEAHPDVKVEWTFFADDPEAFAKIQSGFVADLVHPNSSWLKIYVQNGLLQPIDTSKLSNWPNVLPELAKLGQVDGVQYMIPWEWGYDSILVRTDRVQEVPDSWADLWDPQYAGHVSIFDSAEASVVMTSLVLGYDPYTLTDAQLEDVKQKLIELKPNLLGYWTDYTEINQQVASGEVWVAGGAWPDAYVAAAAEGIAVEYIQPVEGRIGWVYGYAIPANAKNPDLAHEYADAMLSEAAMAEMANQYAYGVANQKALMSMNPEFIDLMQLETPDILERTQFFQTLTPEQREAWTQMWTEVKAAQ